MEITWKNAILYTTFAAVLSLIANKIIMSIYINIFQAAAPGDPILWFFAFGGLVLNIIMGIIAVLIFIEQGSLLRGIAAELGAALITLLIFWAWAGVYDYAYTTAFVNYQWYDWLLGIDYIFTYFAKLGLGSTDMFWFVGTLIFSIASPFCLKAVSVRQKNKYLKNRVEKNGW
jgi:hypothetical protein